MSPETRPILCLVIPCFNEGKRLPVDKFKDFSTAHPDIILLFVDDGSTDDTLALLNDFRVKRLPRNRGKAEAVRQGILEALDSNPDFVGFWDADLATPLEAVADFLAVFNAKPGVDLVVGSRVQLLGRTIERSALRHYFGRVFATASSAILALPIYDTQCGAKIFRAKPFVRDLFAETFVSHWAFDVEIIARWMRSRKDSALPSVEAAIYECPLLTWRDVAGSKVRPLDFFKSFFELGRIYLRYLT